MTNEELVAKLNAENVMFVVIDGEAMSKCKCGHYKPLIDSFDEVYYDLHRECEDCETAKEWAKQASDKDELEYRLEALKMVPKRLIEAIEDKSRELNKLELQALILMKKSNDRFRLDGSYENMARIDNYYDIKEGRNIEI